MLAYLQRTTVISCHFQEKFLISIIAPSSYLHFIFHISLTNYFYTLLLLDCTLCLLYLSTINVPLLPRMPPLEISFCDEIYQTIMLIYFYETSYPSMIHSYRYFNQNYRHDPIFSAIDTTPPKAPLGLVLHHQHGR